jgi:glycosyltransferase involved in cell wall biosynthesis
MRVLHAPELAGLAGIMAEALRGLGVVANSVGYTSHPYGFRSDIELNLQRYPRPIKLLRMLLFATYALREYDLFHFHYGTSLLPRQLDLAIIKSLGKRIVAHFHGSDICNEEFVLHAADRYRGLESTEGNGPPLSTGAQLRRLARWRKYADGMFVATPDLLSIVPEAVYLPQAIDLRRWEFAPTENTHGSRLTVLHLPSHRGLKGTEFVARAIEQVISSGHSIELRLAERYGHDEVHSLYRDADIVVDQLLIGAYGLVSVEAMATGRPVICYIADDVRPLYPDSLPVESATPSDLGNVLLGLMSNKGLRRRLAYEGRRYVERYHDSRVVARVLLDYYCNF